MPLPRRLFLAASAALMLGAAAASARGVVDSAGRSVEVPDHVARVFAAGPPASTLLYALAPEDMIGWNRTPHPAELPYLLPAVRALPELGRLTGRGDTLNLEALVAAKPDLIVDYGTVNDTYRSLADRVQAQTGIPYVLIDGRFANAPAALRLLGGILGVPERGEALATSAEAILAEVDRVLGAVPDAKRPRVYLARGPDGLETGSRGSINTEIIERAGATNVAEGLRERGGLVHVSPEQVIAWAPDTVITLDRAFRDGVRALPAWAPVPAVARGRVYLAPGLPFGFIDAPPSINRFLGLIWLLHTLYPAEAHGDVKEQVKGFFHLFYQVDPSDAELDALLFGASR